MCEGRGKKLGKRLNSLCGLGKVLIQNLPQTEASTVSQPRQRQGKGVASESCLSLGKESFYITFVIITITLRNLTWRLYMAVTLG